MIAAGKHGLGVLSIGAGIPGGPEMPCRQAVGNLRGDGRQARKDGMDRKQVAPGRQHAHATEDDEQALRQVRAGERRETMTYFEDTLGRPPGRADDPLRDGVKMGTTLVGSPDTVAKGIERLIELLQRRLRRRPVPRP
jgi:limonene 1,2-monooxygenase